MSMPEIVLLDDDPREVDTLIRLINLYYHGTPGLKLSRGNPHGFTSGSATLEYFTGGKPVDIVFLDIIMPEMSGVEVAACLRDKGFGGYIVFLTSANDFAAESYRVAAFSYLLKPVEKEQLFSVMRKIEDARSKSRREDTAAVLVQTRQYHRNILFRDIVFAEIMGHSLSLHLVNNETVSINKPLKEFAPVLLVDERFAHCHGSIIVNLDFVETIKDNTVVLKPGGSIPMSRRFNDFKSRYITRSIRKFMG
ncbi:MAG: LytTR family DNA-binding domain-containing protein [Treponema sp.]|jgi:DNA-binding LytR/AlgR family response regulator|nr:LytTR family DNA-binding domain-containing protein [Treponema sp.]